MNKYEYTVQVPPALLMCKRHWRMPKDIQDAVWRHYQAGQEQGRTRPTEEFEAFHATINAVAETESKQKEEQQKQGRFF